MFSGAAELPRDFYLAMLIGGHKFRRQCLEHRRAGRHFGDLDPGPEMLGHRGQLRAHSFSDVVALELALRLSDQVHLDVGDIGPAPQEVMANEPIEVVRRGYTGVGL